MTLENNPQGGSGRNLDPGEVSRFDGWSGGWWDLEGEFKSLHKINPHRLAFIDDRAHLAGKEVLDVGCGGGILAEGMAARGARVTGIDLSEEGLKAARGHLRVSGLAVDYRLVAIEELAAERPASFDVVTCMEMIEHVPDPASVVRSCAALVRPGGHVFFSTLNRNPKSYLFAIVGAEYLLRLLPRGTHEYRKLVRPAELEAWCGEAGLRVSEMRGILYNVLTRKFHIGRDISVNYIVASQKAG